MARLDLDRTRRFEARVPPSFDRILATSTVDAAHLMSLMGDNAGVAPTMLSAVDVVPNGVDLDYFTSDGGPRDPATLVFTGKMSYHANVTAALSLLRDIMPRIWSQRPDVKLVIVGKKPPKAIRDLADRHAGRVTVTGFVPDIRPYLRRSTIAVAPISYGAGIQNKVLEAMACGTPVVATSAAARALEAEPGHELLLADEPMAFAATVVSLLRDPERRRSIGEAGRAYAERTHSWSKMTERLENIYDELIAY